MKEKILIVEDNPVHMRLIEMTLRAKDYTLLKAASGEEALEIAVSVVVKGKCQGLMFSDSVSPTPFKQLRRFVPRLR